MDNRPIGMFDSGCGGLTVLKQYIKYMPNEDFIYYGDTAHLPYGDKSPQKIIEYSEKIVKFLIDKNVKLIVIACGTASANAFNYLKEKYDIDIRNIIEPTSSSITTNNIGVIATKSTIKSKAWENSILKYNNSANIISMACPLLVPLIEEGFINTPATNYVINEYLKNFIDSNGKPLISSLILGCTHYPLLKENFSKILGEDVDIIDVGTYSAKDTLNFLDTNNMKNSIEHTGNLSFFSSDDFGTFKENAKLLDFIIN